MPREEVHAESAGLVLELEGASISVGALRSCNRVPRIPQMGVSICLRGSAKVYGLSL